MKKQKSGLYRTSVTIGTGPDGKPIKKYISGRTKHNLETARQAVVDQYIKHTALTTDTLIGPYAIRWYREFKQPRLSVSTETRYRIALNNHFLPTFGDRHFRAVTAADIQAYVNKFTGMSDTTIKLHIIICRSVFGAAVSDGILTADPTARIVRPEHMKSAEKRALTPDERKRLLDALPGSPIELGVLIMYYTGMRIGEVRGLKWGDIDFQTATIHVQRDVDDHHLDGDALKTAASDRIVPVVAPLMDVLRAQRGLPSAWVTFTRNGNPVLLTSIRYHWNNLIRAAGIPDSVTPHCLRHTFITVCWEAGIDPGVVQKIVGHSSYMITMGIYTHISEAHARKAVDGLTAQFAKVAQQLHVVPEETEKTP
ncbi:MAG: site-specific integrase, partial [Bacteroidales bacterium]|nr:site-specific integrase [Bacteroidales bacterium]